MLVLLSIRGDITYKFVKNMNISIRIFDVFRFPIILQVYVKVYVVYLLYIPIQNTIRSEPSRFQPDSQSDWDGPPENHFRPGLGAKKFYNRSNNRVRVTGKLFRPCSDQILLRRRENDFRSGQIFKRLIVRNILLHVLYGWIPIYIYNRCERALLHKLCVYFTCILHVRFIYKY